MRGSTAFAGANRVALSSGNHRNRPRPSTTSVSRPTSSSSSSSSSFARVSLDRRRAETGERPLQRPPRTSEFWYEDEEEFDAIAGSLRRKRVYVFGLGDTGSESAPPSSSSSSAAAAAAASLLLLEEAASRLSRVAFDACFYGSTEECERATAAALASLWPKERSGPPYFLKPRRRPALDDLASRVSSSSPPPSSSSSSDAEAAAAADEAWRELASQNWRVELGHGLGAGAAADPERDEALLVVLPSPEAAAALLLSAALADHGGKGAAAALSGGDAGEPYAVVTFRAWEGGGGEDGSAPNWKDLVE